MRLLHLQFSRHDFGWQYFCDRLPSEQNRNKFSEWNGPFQVCPYGGDRLKLASEVSKFIYNIHQKINGDKNVP